MEGRLSEGISIEDGNAKEPPCLQNQYESYHHHNESISTSASDSADSSPTTTISTVDDSSATEMSPGSSPESPMAKPYPSAFGISETRPRTAGDISTMNSSGPFFELQRTTTPVKKPRNLKNLAVNTAGSLHGGRAASTTSLPVTTALDKLALDDSSKDGAPAQSFTKPPSPPKRKPNNLGLTITTTASTKALPQHVRLAIPPTPSLTRPNVLRHFQSSPSLPLYTSDFGNSSVSPVGPSIDVVVQQQGGPRSPLRSDDSEPNFDIPQSKEEKPDAYPNGPICVYGPHLDLYLEPTAEQALEYDVIMNVASEVKNPFDKSVSPIMSGPEFRLDGGGGIQYAPKRNFLAARSAFQGDVLTPVHESSPTTPKATPFRDTFPLANVSRAKTGTEPEYIHVPWEHNTDIVPDLLRLVKLIDDRVQHGKRVLIHCQCGVSRSATLVVAYVIFKNPSMSVQEAYDTVKKRSRWIGPNMNLIMQLQEFRSSLGRSTNRFGSLRGSVSPISPSLPISEWDRPGPHSDTQADFTSPKTAPLLLGAGLSSTLAVIPDSGSISPGPSSAPSGFAWPSQVEPARDPVHSVAVSHQDAAYVDTSGHVVPVVKIVEEPLTLEIATATKDKPLALNLESHNRQDSGRHITPMMSPRSEEFAMIPLQPSLDVDSADQFGLMSPQASEFPHSPFDRAYLLSTLGMGSALQPPPPKPRHLSPIPGKESRGIKSTGDLPLRPKISAPSLHEQQQLQHLQSEIETTLTQQVDGPSLDPAAGLEALMSPRAIEFTQNPFALSDDSKEEQAAAPLAGEEDPRSPAQKGASPITRNIFDVL